MKKYTSEEDLSSVLTESKSYTDTGLEDKVDKDNCPFRFGIDSNGNYGYYKVGADTVTPFKTVAKKVGTIICGWKENVLDCSKFEDRDRLTVDNFYLMPTAFVIQNIKDDTATKSEVTLGTYYLRKTFNNYILTVQRDSIQGDVGVELQCDVYIIY